MSSNIHIKRIYEPCQPDDGYRVLVDRIWPRGVSRQNAHLDEWMKDIAPSNELRQWFDHRPERFTDFSTRYETELQSYQPDLLRLKALAEQEGLCLLYSARNELYNQAVVLLRVIREL